MRQINKGFTLIELLIAMVVLAVAASYAIPNFRSQLESNRAVALGEELVTAINFARSEAVKRGRRVSMCPTTDGVACSDKWSDGFMVFIDNATADKAAAPILGSTADILRSWDKKGKQSKITATYGTGTDAAPFIRYTGLGTLARVKPDPVVFLAQMETCSGDTARQVTVSLSGLVSIVKANCKNE